MERVTRFAIERLRVLDKLIAWVKGDVHEDDDWPICPVHGEPMVFVKVVGKAAKYTDQENQTYTLIFRCPVPGCDETATRTRLRTQIPAPGEGPRRPSWAARDQTSV
jgi:hypothetical protein